MLNHSYGPLRKLNLRHLTRCWQSLAPELGHKDVGLEGVLLPISLLLQRATYSSRLKIECWSGEIFGFNAQGINSHRGGGGGVRCYRFPPSCFAGTLNGLPCF